MSLPFSNTTNKNGIIQKIERNLWGSDGDGRITSSTLLLAQFTADVNLASDKIFNIIFKADGKWQFDDSNHTDFPTITTDLVSGQRAYTFVDDENGNVILEIHKAYALPDEGDVFQMLRPTDELENQDYWSGINVEGSPIQYAKKANAVFLNLIPNYDKTNGLKVEINREASYFVVGDTTKKPGFAGLFHEYLAVQPSYEYASLNGLDKAGALRVKMLEMEKEVENHYSGRDPDDRKIMRGKKILYI